jgi:hypothetical protein
MIGDECVDLKEEPIVGQRLLLGVRQAATDTIQARPTTLISRDVTFTVPVSFCTTVYGVFEGNRRKSTL